MSVRDWLVERFFRDAVDARVRAALPVLDGPGHNAEAGWREVANASPRARRWHEVRATLEQVAQVCRSNPLAARLVAMTTDFVVGAGAQLEGPPYAHAFWNDPRNRMDLRIYRWCDELSRTGELFLVLSRNPVTGMSYVREVPALLVDQVATDGDDLERELRYHQLTSDAQGIWWPAAGAEGDADQVMLHYTINRPVGEVRGVSDLAQIVTWLQRYDLWLEDRVRINRYRGAYLWHVKVQNALPGQLEAKRAQYSRVPNSGSIIVTDGHETWTAVQPQINADDAEADGRAIRLMVAAGAGVPLHFLAEGETATRATAREMGTATYRHFAHRQHVFASMVEDVIRVAARRAGDDAEGVRVVFESVVEEACRPEAGSRAERPEGEGELEMEGANA